jgi:hypothetical protein
MTRRLRALAHLAALLGVIALLLADSAEPSCRVVAFRREYALSTDCGGDASETLLVTLAAGEDGNDWPANVEHISGDTLVVGAGLWGTCDEDGDRARYTQVTLQMIVEPDPAVGGATRRFFCELDPEGGTVGCREGQEPDPSCTATIAVVP